MASQERPGSEPRTFFLNERHELTHIEREPQIRPADYVQIEWRGRADSLLASFGDATVTAGSADPSTRQHHFVVAVPVATVAKRSKSKAVPSGIKHERPEFGGKLSTLFRRLGMDLIETLPDGRATVHVPAERTAQIRSSLVSLVSANPRERGRWIWFEKFAAIHWSTRVSTDWVESLAAGEGVETMLRFQPVLRRAQVLEVLEALRAQFSGRPLSLLRTGREFSGRHWCLANMTRAEILDIAQEFPSIQSIHAPMYSEVAAPRARRQSPPSALPSSTIRVEKSAAANLPTVGVVDCGIPENHVLLGPYRRSGYRNPNIDPMTPYLGDHGSFVGTCVVFGRLGSEVVASPPTRGTCRVMDVMVARDATHVDDEQVVQAMDAVVGTSPDVRVFNLSYGGKPLSTMNEVTRREEQMKLQDLDNFAFARDVLLVIASGNSPPGVVPEPAYPHHSADLRWGMGAIASSFNGAVCGSYVDISSDLGVGGVEGAPSPFTRIGPGHCGALPGFSGPGGDCNRADYRRAPDTGPWVSTAFGTWEDQIGTSYAAPLVAREAAWIFSELAKRCAGVTVPFAATVKAWMRLAASRPTLTGAYEALAKKTLGAGFPVVAPLQSPDPSSAVFVWQTLLATSGEANRVQVPVPLPWLREAKQPTLRVVCAWHTPVNIALTETWACRKVDLRVRPFSSKAAHRGRGNSNGAFPLIDRLYDLSPSALSGFQESDAPWIVEVEYSEVGEYPPGMTVSAQQRVGVVLELCDVGDDPASAQAAVQALPLATELVRLSVLEEALQAPVTIRT